MTDVLPNGAALRSARLSMGLRLEEVARNICSPSYLSLIENGKRPLTLRVWSGLKPRLEQGLGGLGLLEDFALISGLETATRLCERPKSSLLARLDTKLAELIVLAIDAELGGDTKSAVGKYRQLDSRITDLYDVESTPGSQWAQVTRLRLVLAEKIVRLEADTDRLDEAISIAEAVLREPVYSDSVEQIRQLKGLLAGLYSERGDYKRADDLLDEVSTSSDKPSDRAIALWLRGQMLLDQGRPLESAYVLNAACALLEDIASTATKYRLLNASIWSQCLAGTLLNPHAITEMAAAVSFFRESQNLPDLLSCLNTMAFACAIDGYSNLAVKYNSECEQRVEDLQGSRKASLYTGLAKVQACLGESEKALASLQKASQNLDELEFGRKSATVWAQMAEIYEGLGESELSLACLRTSLSSMGIGTSADRTIRSFLR